MTTNNLIGYDPLAWMDGETLEETLPPAPVKKATKTKAKAAPVVDKPEPEEPAALEEVVDEESVVQEAAEVVEVEEPESDIPVVTVDDDAIESAAKEIDIDITVDKDGDIEIVVEADQDAEVAIEIAVETSQMDDDVMDEIVEEVTEMPTEESEAKVSESEPETKVEPLIELNSEATIKNIAALYDTLKRALAAHDTIEINASDVTTIDTATLQLLVSLKKDTLQSNKTVDIIYPSTRFIESAKLLNLLDVLEVTEI